jgi:hypothetical protein
MRSQTSTKMANTNKSRNAFVFGFTPQAELWNGRLAMISLTLYFIWLFKSSSMTHNC